MATQVISNPSRRQPRATNRPSRRVPWGVNESTVRRHLDWLTQTFMVRQLQPWFENIGKRQVKAPMIYFPDTGLLHALLGIAIG